VGFPKGRVLCRGLVIAEATYTSRWWVAFVAAAAGAALGLLLSGSAAAVVGALATPVVLLIVIAGWEVGRYVAAGYRDPRWDAYAHLNGTSLEVMLRPVGSTTSHEADNEFSRRECAVRMPFGEVMTVPDSEIRTLAFGPTARNLDAQGPGTYEVRWYGAKRRLLFEVARAKLAL
jgi:hypothetical protein